MRRLGALASMTKSGASRLLRSAAASWIAIGFLLVVANVLNNELLPEAYVFTCVVTALALVGVARAAGCTWTDLGLNRESLGPGLRWSVASSSCSGQARRGHERSASSCHCSAGCARC